MNITKYYILNKKNCYFFDLNFVMLLLYINYEFFFKKKRQCVLMTLSLLRIVEAVIQTLFHPDKTRRFAD